MVRDHLISMRLFPVDVVALVALSKVSQMSPSTIARYLFREGLKATSDCTIGDLRMRVVATEGEAVGKQVAYERTFEDPEQQATVSSIIESAGK